MFPELETHFSEYRNRRFPDFGRPRLIGFLSLDNERFPHADTSQLKFARLPSAGSEHVSYNLDHGLDLAIHRSTESRDEKLSILLRYLLDQEKRLRPRLEDNNAKCTLESTTFLCYRGLLTLVACTPYEPREGWRVVATLHRGAIYLCARETADSITRQARLTEKDLQFTSWGYKFEQYLTSDSPTSEPETQSPVNENEEFSLVFTNHLNRHRIIYAAEMDGIRCDKTHVEPPPRAEDGQDAIIDYLSKQEFIELKTNRHIEFPNQENNFRRFKAKKWWCQSFLAGVETIVCGFRDDEGVVEMLKTFNVRDLPKMCSKFWEPGVCFSFLDTFLTYVKRCLAKEITRRHGVKCLEDVRKVPLTALHFEWSPRQRVHVTDNYDPVEDPILPKWFLENYGKANA